MVKARDARVTFDGLASSDAIKEHVIDKLSKYENFLEDAVSLSVVLVEEKPTRGTDNDFKVSINVGLPGKDFHVEEVGMDMYVLIDSVVDTMYRRLRKRHEKLMDRNR